MLEVDLATEDSAGFMVCGEEDYDDEEEEDDEDEEEANDDYDEDEANYDLAVTAATATKQTEPPYHSSLRKGGTSSAAARYAAASGKRRLSQPVLYTQKTTPTFSYLAYRRSSEGILHSKENIPRFFVSWLLITISQCSCLFSKPFVRADGKRS